MGRPSLAESRREEMLAAITRCIGQHGLAGSTQEVIARESGFSRSHIRHYLGNRDAVVNAVWEHVMTPYWSQMARAMETPDLDLRTQRLLDFLFGPEMERKPEDRTIQALIDGAGRHPELLAKIEFTYHELESQVSKHLQSLAPKADRERADDAAFAIISLAFGSSIFSALNFPPRRWRGAQRVACMIIDELVAATA